MTKHKEGEGSGPMQWLTTKCWSVRSFFPKLFVTLTKSVFSAFPTTTTTIPQQAMPQIEHNADGFYYIVGWQRADVQGAQVETARVDEYWVWHYVVPEEMPPYVPFNVWVKAGNSIGEAAITPRTVIGYSGEDGHYKSILI